MSRSHRKPLPPCLADLGAAVKTMRMRKRMTQCEVAERVGIDQSRISLIERGEIDFCISKLMSLASALGWAVLLVPEERVVEARRAAGLSERTAGLPTVAQIVGIPDPEEGDDEMS